MSRGTGCIQKRLGRLRLSSNVSTEYLVLKRKQASSKGVCTRSKPSRLTSVGKIISSVAKI